MTEEELISEGGAVAVEVQGDPETYAFNLQRHHARMAASYRMRADKAKGEEKKKMLQALKFHQARVSDTIKTIKKLREDADMDQIDELSNATLKAYTHKANQDRTKSFGDKKRYDKRLTGADTAVKKMHEEGLDEKVLDVQARMKRAAQMRRNETRIQRAKEIAAKRMAPEKNIKKRAYSAARNIMRRRVAGARGADYAQMGPSEKMAIDRLIDGKQKIIKKIALRLLPRVRQAEQKRLASFMRGAPLENNGAKEGHVVATMESKSVDKKLNKKFAEKFAKPTEKKEVSLYPKDSKPNVKFHSSFEEEAAAGSATYKGLLKKSFKSGVDIDIVGEVYNRGLTTWNEDMDLTQQQYAFARVNSFIHQGKSYFNEDVDLREITRRGAQKYIDKARTSADDLRWKSYGEYMGPDADWEATPSSIKAGAKAAQREKMIALARAKRNKSGETAAHYTPHAKAKVKATNEAREPGKPSVTRYKRPDGTTALKSLNKWGKRKDWQDTEGGLKKAREHSKSDLSEVSSDLANRAANKAYQASHRAYDDVEVLNRGIRSAEKRKNFNKADDLNDKAYSLMSKVDKKERQGDKFSKYAAAKTGVKEETIVSKGKSSGTRWEMRTRLAGEPGEYSSIIKTHQDGKHLQNRWGGYNVYKTGKTPYIKKHFERLALKEETLTEHRGYKDPELEAAGYQFKSHLGATGNRDASTLYYHPALDKHIEITHERTGMAGSKKRHYFYSGKLGSNSGGMQSMHPTLSDAIRKNKGELKEEALNEANRLKYDAAGKQWYHSPNGGFTWKRVTSDEAKKAYPGKHKDITAEHGLKEETLSENLSTFSDKAIKHFAKVDPAYKTTRSSAGETMHHVNGKTIYFSRSGPDNVAVINHHDKQSPEVAASFARIRRALQEAALDDGGYYAAREMYGNDYAVARHIYDRYRGQHTSKHIDSAIEDLGGDKEKIIKHLGRFRAVKKMHSTGRDPKYTKEETLSEDTYHERVKNHPAVESVDNGGKGEYFVNLKHPYHWSGQKSFGVDSASHALKMLKDVKKGIAGVDFEEEYVAEMSWTKQVQYADAAKKDRLDKFNQSLATKDPAEKAALLKRIDNRNKTIQKVMDRSGWNRKNSVEEEIFTIDKEPVIIPPIRNADGTTRPAKTVMRRVRKKILGTGNVHDGK